MLHKFISFFKHYLKIGLLFVTEKMDFPTSVTPIKPTEPDTKVAWGLLVR
jgi:hypothetical protein